MPLLPGIGLLLISKGGFFFQRNLLFSCPFFSHSTLDKNNNCNQSVSAYMLVVLHTIYLALPTILQSSHIIMLVE